MTKVHFKLVVLAGLAALIGLAPAASAGIIVVNGKSDSPKSGKSLDDADCNAAIQNGADVLPAECDPEQTATAGGGMPRGIDHVEDDLGEVDSDWVCEEIGAGIEICAPPNSPEGPEPQIDPVGEEPSDQIPADEMGCSGGSTPGGLLMLLFALAVLVGLRVRRRLA